MTSRESVPARVFVDTSAFFALISGRDTNHAAAVSILRSLSVSQSQLVTSNFIRAETHALLLVRLGRDVALRFIQSLAAGSTEIVGVTASDESGAVEIIKQYEDKNFSLTDATSFAIMRRLRLTTAFAFDRNFRQYGLDLLHG